MRTKGNIQLGLNFEPTGASIIDARLLVSTKADLIAQETYAEKNVYKGMLVTVQDTNELYMLIDPDQITNSSYTGWKRMDAGATESVEIIDDLTTGGSTKALSAEQGKVLKGLIDSNKSTIDSYTINGKKISTNPSIDKSDVGLSNVTNDAQVKRSEMGVASGVATLDENGKVPASQLNGDLGRVVGIQKFLNTQAELSSDPNASTAKEGDKYFCKDTKKIYTKTSDSWDEGVDPKDNTLYNHRLADDQGRTNVLYRWDGDAMAEVSASIALGETQGTAYEGSKGKANADAIKSLQSKTTQIDAYTVNGKKINTNPILDGSSVNLSTSFTEAEEYTDPAQGDSIDTAIGKLAKGVKDATQSAGVTSLNGEKGAVVLATGDTNGTFKVNSKEVSIAGLKSAAYQDSSAFDTAGKADQVKTAVIGTEDDTSDMDTIKAAKKYADEKDAELKTAIGNYTINGKKISTNPTLDGTSITLTGYSIADTAEAVAESDTVNKAIGKLEKTIEDNELAIAGALNVMNESLGFSESGAFEPTNEELSGMNVTEAIDHIASKVEATTNYYTVSIDSGNTKSIPASTHKCGTLPLVQTYLGTESVECNISVASNGDVTLNWNGSSVNSGTPLKVVIIGK